MKSLVEMSKPVTSLPPRIIIMGEPGVGKTTLARDLGAVILPVGKEEGYQYLNPAAPVLVPDGYRTIPSLEWLCHFLDRLLNEDHPYKVVAIDTLDALEKIVWSELCREFKVKSIEQVANGYGKGFMMTSERVMASVCTRLDALRGKGIMPVILAHSKEKTTRDQDLNEFSAWSINISGKAFPEDISGWCDGLFMATFRRTFRTENPGKQNEKNIPTQMPMKRMLRMSPAPGAVTKCRIQAPDEIEITPGNEAIKALFNQWLKTTPAPAGTWTPVEG